MNINELSVRDRILYSATPKEKEVAVVKRLTFDGKVIIRTASGKQIDVTDSQIIKIIGKV